MIVRCGWLLAALAIASAGPLCTSRAVAADYDGAAPFERALEVRHVAIGRAQTVPASNKEVRCFYFAPIMVKEIDEREMGDSQISYIPRKAGEATPACRRAALPGERVLPLNNATVYFLGFAAGTIFLTDADGSNGTLPFSAYDPGADRLRFEDAMKLGTKFASIAADGDMLRLHYTRAVTGTCSVVADGDACWATLARQTSLPVAPAPACRAGYEQAGRALADEACRLRHGNRAACLSDELSRRASWDKAPSVIGYGVDVAVPPAGQAAMTPANGPIACWPSD
jgi:hypothetical protein